MSRFFNLFLLLLAEVGFSECFKILIVFGAPSKSHALLGDGYARILAEAGHEVTYITPYVNEKLPANVRLIHIPSQINLQDGIEDFVNLDILLNKEVDIKNIGLVFHLSGLYSRGLIHHENVQELILDPKEEFDLVIVEWLYSELTCGLAAVFNCPFIWSSSMEPHWQALRLIDDPPHPAYTTDIVTEATAPFSFMERVEQLWMMIKVNLLKMFHFNSIDEENFQKAFGPAVTIRGRTLPTLDEVRYNGSLMLGNSHISTGDVVKVPRNYVDVGGYHIADKVDPLPEDLQTLIDNSKKGVIFFSMGSIIKGTHLPQQIKDELIQLFSELKDYTILWKLEINLDVPKNVRILNWAPQASILAHNKTKLFITHGGLLSTLEAVRFGVPLIGIPVFADQHLNINRAVNKGFGRRVDLSYNMAKDLKEAVSDILNDERYVQKAQEFSNIFHNRLSSPREEILHWVKIVVETKGAQHLRSPALSVPLYQKLYLDLLGIIFVAIFLTVLVVKRLYVFVKKVCLRKEKKA